MDGLGRTSELFDWVTQQRRSGAFKVSKLAVTAYLNWHGAEAAGQAAE
jgi:hypothetical protein